MRLSIDLIGNVICSIVSTLALPLALFLMYRVQKKAGTLMLSMLVRLQIAIWGFLICNMSILTIYKLTYFYLDTTGSVNLGGRNSPGSNETLEGIKSPSLKPNNQVMFLFNSAYILSFNASRICGTLILFDRCTALMFPIHHTKTMGQILIRIFIVLIIAATLISCLQFVLMDGASFYDAKCYTVNCFFPRTMMSAFYLRFALILINLSLAILFCILLFKRHTRNTVLRHRSHYFNQRANIIATWSVFSETAFGILPYLPILIRMLFDINFFINDNLIMASTALDGFFTLLIYTKIIVLKKPRVVPSTT